MTIAANWPVPIVLRFKASFEPLGEGEYFVSYDFGTSQPVVTAVGTSKGGIKNSSFQYQQQKAEASVRTGLNKVITILKFPDKEVSLELQSVEE